MSIFRAGGQEQKDYTKAISELRAWDNQRLSQRLLLIKQNCLVEVIVVSLMRSGEIIGDRMKKKFEHARERAEYGKGSAIKIGP